MADQSLCDDVYLNYIIVICRRHDGWTVTLWCMSISIILLYILGGLMSEQSLCDDVYLNYIIVYFRRTWCLNSHFVMMSISIILLYILGGHNGWSVSLWWNWSQVDVWREFWWGGWYRQVGWHVTNLF